MNRLSTILALSLMASPHAFADNLPRHGYIDTPPSRAFLCSSQGGGGNQMCGSVQYEPQSIEGLKGFPNAGPSDGHIASGGNPRFNNLDEQSSSRWKKVDIISGKKNFSWTLTAPHRTTSWRYFITQQNWNPNKPLERSDFDLTPFCEQFDDGKMPSNKVNITCDIPKRTGYQVILGVWDIADTGNAFYQVIDANFIGNSGGNGGNEQMDDAFISDIRINKQQTDNGNLMSYHLQVDSDNQPSSKPTYQWLLPKNAKDIDNMENKSSFSIEKENEVQTEKARVRVTAGKEYRVLAVDINVPGINTVGYYDYIFPDNMKYYTAGTLVYQPADKHIYQCKPFPFSGFCVQWSPHANQYEPGVGFAWQEAWILVE